MRQGRVRAVGAIQGLKAACSGERVRAPEPQLLTELNVAVPLLPGSTEFSLTTL